MIPAKLDRRGGAALLDIDPPPVPPVVHYAGEEWQAKAEFHVTLVGSKTLKELGVADAAKAMTAIGRAADGIEFGVELLDEYWRLDEDESRTIIRRCDVAGAEEFFVALEGELERTIERPPYHVTLYTINTSNGIGLSSYRDLRRLGTPLGSTIRADE